MSLKTIGLFAGAAILLLFLVLPAPESMKPEAMRTCGVTLLMTIWWITEAIPIYATAFVPLVLFPALGILGSADTAENYAHNYVLMLLGGLIIAKAIELQNLHKRIALLTIRFIGVDRKRIILSFMIATAFLSMWLANVAVALMMLPIAMAVVKKEEVEDGSTKFGQAMMLAIAYASSVGGMATLIGTPPNLILAGMMKSLYPRAPEITFTDWLIIGLPLVVILLPIIWVYLLMFFKIGGRISGSAEIIKHELKTLGKMTAAESRVLYVFIFTALGWIFRNDLNFGNSVLPGWGSLLGISEYVHDTTVAMLGVMLLFVIPSGEVKNGKRKSLMDWKAAESVPWGVVMIVGGGYALAESFTHTGLADWLGTQVTFLQGMPAFWVLLIVVFFITFFTEINSNTATANICLPILATVAMANHSHPFLLMIPGTFACSCAFMLPSGTGTNAVVFSSGRITIPEMASCGFYLNFISIAVITIVMYLIAVPWFGISPGVPGWAQ